MPIGFIILFLLTIPISILLIVSMWRIYTKASEPGWAIFVPIYSFIVLMKIIGKPWWWLFLLCISGVNIVFLVWTYNLLSKSFGKDEGFTVGLLLLGVIFIPILGLGKAKYVGPAGDAEAMNAMRQRNTFDVEQDRLSS